jgi:hypothetical protein
MLTITADELPRFMACNGSRNINKVQPFEPDNTMRDEGDAAHWLIEQVFNKRFGLDELVGRPAFNGVYITEEMAEAVTACLEDIRGRGAVEVITSYGDGRLYQVNGRADWVAFEGTTLFIGDFKYGWSIIEPDNNWTLLSHAIGWLLRRSNTLRLQQQWLFANPIIAVGVSHVTLRIWQPRPHHPSGKRVRSVTYPVSEIWNYWNEMMLRLTNPNNMLNTGKHCKDCLGMINCSAAQKAGMNALEVSELGYVSNPDEATLAFIIEQSERAIKILEQNRKAATDLALHRIKAGKIVPGYTVDRELTNKQWKQGITVETAAMLIGKDLGKKQLITPAQAVKSGVAQEVVDALCERREKGVKLVKRDANATVKKMFNLTN